MERLERMFVTAKSLVPQPIRRDASQTTKLGVLYFGSTSPAMDEALDLLSEDGKHVNAMRLRAFPFPESVRNFILEHDMVFLVEQNRDGQMRTMMISELEMDPARIIPVLHYDGTPITGQFIAGAIGAKIEELKVVSLERAVS
jgi:2-oxoglutarate ferredoxin oxidoreductase subunit alpha